MVLRGGKDAVILGGGLAGLSAGYILSRKGKEVLIIEKDSDVGGLSKTIVHGEYRFDLGGHRFFTKNVAIDRFVRDLMGDELLEVNRKSKIFLNNKYFDYPPKPLNSVFGLGIDTTLRIVLDYWIEKIKCIVKKPEIISLEDWVVSNFGRKMFDIYFKQYSEKVWGIDCSNISEDWVSKRIQGLSLGKAIKKAFFKSIGNDLPTLTDKFIYPKLGIGRISDRLRDGINGDSSVMTETSAIRVNHNGKRIENIEAVNCKNAYRIESDNIVSSIPLTALVKILNPRPPSDVLETAGRLRFRDIIIVAMIIDRHQVTDQSWIYIPESNIPFGRIHEPKNWSPYMAPEGKSIMVIEYFCFKEDEIWKKTDKEITHITSRNLSSLGFIKESEVIDSVVIRAANAYPLFEVGYQSHIKKLEDYLLRFENLHIVGRGGLFKYYNMDHAIESGIKTAEKLLVNNI